jgi:hypothetical protein
MMIGSSCRISILTLFKRIKLYISSNILLSFYYKNLIFIFLLMVNNNGSSKANVICWGNSLNEDDNQLYSDMYIINNK